MSWIDDILNTLAAPLTPYTTPGAIVARALIVLGAAFVLSLTTTMANRFLVNYRMVNSYRKEYMNWMKSVNKARKEGDEKQLEKLMRRQGAVMKMNTRASLESFKVMPITIVPFLLIYNVLSRAFIPNGAPLPVAHSPIALPFTGPELTLFYWYLICSFAISVPLSRIFGVQTFSMTGGGDTK